MPTLEEIRTALRRHRLEVVAAETGLAYGTVRRYATGRVTEPPLATVAKLADWLSENAGRDTLTR